MRSTRRSGGKEPGNQRRERDVIQFARNQLRDREGANMAAQHRLLLASITAMAVLMITSCSSEPNPASTSMLSERGATTVAPNTPSTAGVGVPPPEPEGGEFMQLEPTELQPGETFVAHFADSNGRGGCFLLFPWDGSGWGEPEYQLISDANTGRPLAVLIDENHGCDDYGVEGPGPDGFLLPDDINEGPWRICTENAADKACAQLTVRR